MALSLDDVMLLMAVSVLAGGVAGGLTATVLERCRAARFGRALEDAFGPSSESSASAPSSAPQPRITVSRLDPKRLGLLPPPHQRALPPDEYREWQAAYDRRVRALRDHVPRRDRDRWQLVLDTGNAEEVRHVIQEVKNTYPDLVQDVCGMDQWSYAAPDTIADMVRSGIVFPQYSRRHEPVVFRALVHGHVYLSALEAMAEAGADLNAQDLFDCNLITRLLCPRELEVDMRSPLAGNWNRVMAIDWLLTHGVTLQAPANAPLDDLLRQPPGKGNENYWAALSATVGRLRSTATQHALQQALVQETAAAIARTEPEAPRRI